MKSCNHSNVTCVNHQEIIRKYKCDLCKEVMMCACEKEYAQKYFSHQLQSTTDYETREHISVTLGFQDRVCNSCKGLPEEAKPMAAIYGNSSKIKRYYWREIHSETVIRFAKWSNTHGHKDWLQASIQHKKKYKEIEKEVVTLIKEQHAKKTKYIFKKDISFDEIIIKYNIETINIDAIYISTDGQKSQISYDGKSYTAEKYAAYLFEQKGYRVIETESSPFHVIFGIYMWILIQDYRDAKNNIAMFGDRIAFDQNIKGDIVRTTLPEDFGTSAYYRRRKDDIVTHLDELASDDDDLSWLFDYWLNYSFKFRNYLWAHKEEDIRKARIIVNVLGLNAIKRILHYLVKEYWGRYLGWPDLFVFNKSEYFFIEVKSSKDKLTDNQKDWIKGNFTDLKFPFKLLKLHKINTQSELKKT